MLLKDFIKKYPNDSLEMMTPDGYVFLTPEQAKDLLAGKGVMGHPGDPAYAREIDAEELLSQPVESARWESHVCHMMMGMPVRPGQTDEREVKGMTEHEQERRLKERLKSNYEAYIQQLKTKPALDLIEMASEIAAAKFIYEELEAEGVFFQYAEYLLQFENPLKVLKDGWMSELTVRQSDALSDVVWDMAEKNFGVCKYQMAEDEVLSVNSQGVTMC